MSLRACSTLITLPLRRTSNTMEEAMKGLIRLALAAVAVFLVPQLSYAQIPIVEGVSFGLRALGALSSTRSASDMKDAQAKLPTSEEIERRIDAKVKDLPEADREQRRAELRAMYERAIGRSTTIVGDVSALNQASSANSAAGVLSRIGAAMAVAKAPVPASVLAAGERAANATVAFGNTSAAVAAAGDADSGTRRPSSVDPADEPVVGAIDAQ
jgi:hypothetical protein